MPLIFLLVRRKSVFPWEAIFPRDKWTKSCSVWSSFRRTRRKISNKSLSHQGPTSQVRLSPRTPTASLLSCFLLHGTEFAPLLHAFAISIIIMLIKHTRYRVPYQLGESLIMMMNIFVCNRYFCVVRARQVLLKIPDHSIYSYTAQQPNSTLNLLTVTFYIFNECSFQFSFQTKLHFYSC